MSHLFPSESDLQMAGQRLINDHGTDAWFIAVELAVAAMSSGNAPAAEICIRIADAIEGLRVRPRRWLH